MDTLYISFNSCILLYDNHSLKKSIPNIRNPTNGTHITNVKNLTENLKRSINCSLLFSAYNFANFGLKIPDTNAGICSSILGIVFAIESKPVATVLINKFAINKSKPVCNILFNFLSLSILHFL